MNINSVNDEIAASHNPFEQKAHDQNGVPIAEFIHGDPNQRNLKQLLVAPDVPNTPDGQEFLNWFGGSKVVDENGHPLIVWHGTGNNSFTCFNPAYCEDTGFHFGTLSQATDACVNWMRWELQQGSPGDTARLIPCYLNITNPYIIQEYDPGKWNTAQFLTHLIKRFNLDSSIARKFNEMGKKHGVVAQQQLIISALEALGFDGIKYDNQVEGMFDPDTTSWAAFKPNQIKSALSNSGKFNEDSDDIYQ
jgi:hypothetical protein